MPPGPRSCIRSVATAVAYAAAVTLTACSEGSPTPVDTGSTANSPATSAGDVTSASATSSPAPSSAASSTPPPVVTITSAAPSGPAATRPPTAAPSTAAPSAGLALEVDGLGVVVGASIRQVPFGTTEQTVRTALSGTLGPPRATTLTECGQGPRRQLDREGFSALFDGTKFTGWTDQGHAGRTLTTVNGIGVGSTLAQLRAALGTVTVTTGSLGPEFTASGGLGGILDGTRTTSKVTTLYAGETCFFR